MSRVSGQDCKGLVQMFAASVLLLEMWVPQKSGLGHRAQGGQGVCLGDDPSKDMEGLESGIEDKKKKHHKNTPAKRVAVWTPGAQPHQYLFFFGTGD